jgi:hypothetical protein
MNSEADTMLEDDDSDYSAADLYSDDEDSELYKAAASVYKVASCVYLDEENAPEDFDSVIILASYMSVRFGHDLAFFNQLSRDKSLFSTFQELTAHPPVFKVSSAEKQSIKLTLERAMIERIDYDITQAIRARKLSICDDLTTVK